MSTTEAPLEAGTSKSKSRLGDTLFSATATGAGISILVALAGVAIFLVIQGVPGVTTDQLSAFAGKSNFWAYVWPLVFGTVLAAVIALVIATPLAVGTALVIAFYAPRRLATPLGYVIDLLAAVPSVVYGLWGITFLAPKAQPIYAWLTDHLGWIPLFEGPVSATGKTILTAGMVLAIMVLPIITAICREIFAQTPVLHREAAMALGATRWETIKLAVFPYARSGMVSAVMLGLGRALGETMAVAMVLSPSLAVTFNLVSAENPSTIAANIALSFGERTGVERNTLIATGLVLFVITFAVNFAARAIVARGGKES